MMLYVISYDIPDDERRLKVAKILLDFGRRVQYSMFEAHLDWSSLENLKERLQKVISQAEDSVRIYGICGECKKFIVILGEGMVTQEPDVYVI